MEHRTKEQSLSEVPYIYTPDPQASQESWNRILNEKIRELRTIASWAKMVGYSQVSNSCQEAISSLSSNIGYGE